jgi:hypothetical protein
MFKNKKLQIVYLCKSTTNNCKLTINYYGYDELKFDRNFFENLIYCFKNSDKSLQIKCLFKTL